MKLRETYTCPIEFVHDIIKGKWKMVILWQINHYKRVNLSTLKHDIKGVSQKMLIEHLNELREYQLIGKEEFEGYPLRVEYYINEDKGKKLIEALEIMQKLGIEYLEEFKTSK